MSGDDPEQPPPPPSTPSWETYQQPPSSPPTPEGPPAHGQPTYGQPTYGQPTYGQPAHDQDPYGQAPYGQAGYGQAGYGYVGAMPHPQANTALILGIVALAGTFLCGVLCVVGPFAWATGARVRREIDAEPQRWSGRSEATAGYVMGIVASMLLGLAVLVVFVMIVALAAASP